MMKSLIFCVIVAATLLCLLWPPATALFYVLFGGLPGVAIWTVAPVTALKVLAIGLVGLLIFSVAGYWKKRI